MTLSVDKAGACAPKIPNLKTFVEQKEPDQDQGSSRKETPPRLQSSQLLKRNYTLTHGFFGELGDEIISKQARDYAKETLVYFFQSGLYEVQNLMSVMSTNRGRDKIFGLVQYIIMLYVKCMTSQNRSFDFQRVLQDRHLQKTIQREGRLPSISLVSR